MRGPVRMADQDGNEIAIDRETIALCRCGKSRLRPFCDGTHKLVRFRAPSGAESGATGRLTAGRRGLMLPVMPPRTLAAAPAPPRR